MQTQGLSRGIVLRGIVITPITGQTARVAGVILAHIAVVVNPIGRIVPGDIKGSAGFKMGADIHAQHCPKPKMAGPIGRVWVNP